MAASFVYGQAQVEDRHISSVNNTAEASEPVGGTASNAAELYYQIQVLQQEVLQLRGMVEEQAFQIKKLKQQRLDDYVDLDRRLSQLGTSGSVSAITSQPQGNASQAQNAGAASQQLPKADELKRYKEAYRQATQDPTKAEETLKLFIQDFPNGKYVPNSLFVLGELKLKSGDLEGARSWFTRVVTEYPQHYRATDAKLKLGLVFQMMGDMAQAKKYWGEVANSNSNAAAKAVEYLNTYFPN